MHLAPEIRIDLRRLILLLAVTTALLTLAGTFYASYQAQRHQLILQTLEANRVYAAKLAENTEALLASMRQQLAYSAMRLSTHFDQPEQLAAETDRLLHQTDQFDSVLIVDARRTLRAISPGSLPGLGSPVDTASSREAIKKQQPVVSRPLISDGRLETVISYPILAGDGHYLGYIGGSIYLHQANVLGTLLAEHSDPDGVHLYMVDRQGQILYHRDPQWIGKVMPSNPVRDAVIGGESGSLQVEDRADSDMLAGYAPVASTGWGIVAQSPATAPLAELNSLMLGTLRNAIPLSLLTLFGLWWTSRLIAQPLWQLASNARQLDRQAAAEQIRTVHAWYFEASQIKQALLTGLAQLDLKIGRLNRESITDPLTQLLNRRGMHLSLEQWQLAGQPYAVIAIDIDHFKAVNDRFGHATGDQLLRHLAQLMRQIARQADVLCRYGGEEFIMLLPRTSLVDACGVAERLRQCIADSPSPGGTVVTISLGVAHCPDSRSGPETALKQADQALYAAKNQGRNRVVIAGAA